MACYFMNNKSEISWTFFSVWNWLTMHALTTWLNGWTHALIRNIRHARKKVKCTTKNDDLTIFGLRKINWSAEFRSKCCMWFFSQLSALFSFSLSVCLLKFRFEWVQRNANQTRNLGIFLRAKIENCSIWIIYEKDWRQRPFRGFAFLYRSLLSIARKVFGCFSKLNLAFDTIYWKREEKCTTLDGWYVFVCELSTRPFYWYCMYVCASVVCLIRCQCITLNLKLKAPISKHILHTHRLESL